MTFRLFLVLDKRGVLVMYVFLLLASVTVATTCTLVPWGPIVMRPAKKPGAVLHPSEVQLFKEKMGTHRSSYAPPRGS